jgi:hypothetical protein
VLEVIVEVIVKEYGEGFFPLFKLFSLDFQDLSFSLGTPQKTTTPQTAARR